MCNMLIFLFDVCNEGVVPSPEEEIMRKKAIEKLKQVHSLSLTQPRVFVQLCLYAGLGTLQCYCVTIS